MVDPRVTHLWDTGNVIGQGFLDRFGVTFGGLDYDFFLFDRDATWGDRAPRPVSPGATVINKGRKGLADAAQLLRWRDGLIEPRGRGRHRRHTHGATTDRSVAGVIPERWASAAAIEGCPDAGDVCP